MTEHARLSPSSRHRWQLCPGSVREEAKYPDTPSKASIDGTHSHTLLERCLKEDVWNASRFIGDEMEDHDGRFVVDQSRADRIQVALDYIHNLQPEFNVISERRVHPSKTTGRDDLSGTVDVQIHWNNYRQVEIIDYKDGMNLVEVCNNPQLEQYALGVIDQYNLPQDCLVTMTIIQPKLSIKGLNPVASTSKTVKELREVVAPKLVLEAAATDRPDAPLVPGDVQCKYCKAKGGCSALVNKTMESVGMMFQPIKDEQLIMKAYDSVHTVAQQSANKDPTTMTNEQLRELLEAAPLMRQMLDAAEEEALNRAKAGQPVPGYKLVNGPGSRAWVYDEAEMAAKLVKMGIPKSAIYVTKLVSPPQAEKLVWEKKGVKTTLSEKQLKRMETEYVKKSKGRLTLVPESDPRPAAVVDAAPLFSPVVEHVMGTFKSPEGTKESPDVIHTVHVEIPDWLK